MTSSQLSAPETALAKLQSGVRALHAPEPVVRFADRVPRRAYELLSPQGREVRAARRALARRFLAGDGLEIGALNLPLTLPRGARARYVDRMTVADLRREYPEWEAWDLVEPDVVDDGETLATVPGGSVDFVVANHFIEHTEDPLGTLANHLRVLRPDGVIFMAVPDMRRTPDATRAPTTVEHVDRDHREGPAASRREHFVDHVRAWEGLDEAAAQARGAELDAEDYSIHFHVWTPGTFAELLVHARRALGLPLEIEALQPVRHEFIVILRRPAP
jgi:SAM-dependent methyltransferase